MDAKIEKLNRSYFDPFKNINEIYKDFENNSFLTIEINVSKFWPKLIVKILVKNKLLSLYNVKFIKNDLEIDEF